MAQVRFTFGVLCAALLAPSLAQARGASSPRSAEIVSSPEIRLSVTNRVPACVTPERLTAFLKSRNATLDLQRYGEIAKFYKHYGEAWRVRWDYAVFQMAVETNSLQFRRGNGDPGDVKPKQNNFAGIGTTGGGVPGDSFPDVKTGVLGHIQHLVAYSGEKLAAPVAPRTQLKQADIVEASLRINRPVRFADLARRWAVDPNYWRPIETIAALYRAEHCSRPEPIEAAVPDPKPVPKPMLARRTAGTAGSSVEAGRVAAIPPQRPAAKSAMASAAASPPVDHLRPPACTVTTASYGGTKTLLIRTEAGGGIKITALSVLDGFEESMAQSFIRSHAPGGATLGAYPNRDAALAKARELCGGGA